MVALVFWARIHCDRLQIQHNPDQDNAVTEDERTN